VMPGAAEGMVAQLETNVAQAKPVSQLVREGATPQEILTQVLAGLGAIVVGEQTVRFACHCSADRVTSVLVALGRKEVAGLLTQDGQATVTCEFCNERYLVGRAELEALLQDL
jgi:molecular chaperone Hsp33